MLSNLRDQYYRRKFKCDENSNYYPSDDDITNYENRRANKLLKVVNGKELYDKICQEIYEMDGDPVNGKDDFFEEVMQKVSDLKYQLNVFQLGIIIDELKQHFHFI